MPGFTQSQLSTLEAINPQNSQFVKRPNPVLAEFERQSKLAVSTSTDATLQSIERNQFLQTKSLSSAISSISSNPAVLLSSGNKTGFNAVSTFSTGDTAPNSSVPEFSDELHNLNTLTRELVDEIRVSVDQNAINEQSRRARNKLLSLDRNQVRQGQFERGIGREARFSNKLAATLRTSATATLAFSIPSKRLLKPSMSIPEKQLALLSATHDVLRFSGQELISIRKKDTSNTFDSSLINASNRNIGQIISDALQTTPVLAPLIEVGKFAAKIGKFALTPASTIFGLFKNKKEKDSKLSTGANLAIKAGLKLDHEKVAYQFLATQFPDISQEANNILNRQLGVQENIQGVLEDTLALFTKTRPQRRTNQRETESKTFDPFSGEFVTQKKVSELKDERFKRLVNTRRRERNIFSRVLGLGKKEDVAAAKQAEGSTVNQVGQTHQQNISKSDRAAIKSDLKLVNSVELVNRIIGFVAAGPVGFSIGGALAALALKNIKADKPIEELSIKEAIRPILSKFTILKSKLFKNKTKQDSSKSNLSKANQQKVNIQQNPIHPNHDISSPVKDSLSLKVQSVNIETKRTSINSQDSSEPKQMGLSSSPLKSINAPSSDQPISLSQNTIKEIAMISQDNQPESTIATRLKLVKNKRQDKQDEELKLNEFQTLKDILFELKNDGENSKKKKKGFGFLGSIFGVLKKLAFKVISVLGGFLGSFSGVALGALFTGIFKKGFKFIAGAIAAAFKLGFKLLKSGFVKLFKPILSLIDKIPGVNIIKNVGGKIFEGGSKAAGLVKGALGLSVASKVVAGSKSASKVVAGSNMAVGLSAESKVAAKSIGIGGKLLKGAKFAGRALGKLALPLTAIFGVIDAVKGFTGADELLGRKATFFEKLKLASANVGSGLTLGLLSQKTLASGLGVSLSSKQPINNPVDKTGIAIKSEVNKVVSKTGEDISAKLNATPSIDNSINKVKSSLSIIKTSVVTFLDRTSNLVSNTLSPLKKNVSRFVDAVSNPIGHTPNAESTQLSSSFTPNGTFTTPFLNQANGRAVKNTSAVRDISTSPDINNKKIPLGIRNNNPGNIRATSIKWRGLDSPSENKGFAVFKTPRYGIRALSKNLDAYNRRGLNTVHDIISTWAPSNENDTASYIDAVSSEMDISPTEQLSFPRDKTKLISGIIRHENGKQPFSKSLIESASDTVNRVKSRSQTPISNIALDSISKAKETIGHGAVSLLTSTKELLSPSLNKAKESFGVLKSNVSNALVEAKNKVPSLDNIAAKAKASFGVLKSNVSNALVEAKNKVPFSTSADPVFNNIVNPTVQMGNTSNPIQTTSVSSQSEDIGLLNESIDKLKETIDNLRTVSPGTTNIGAIQRPDIELLANVIGSRLDKVIKVLPTLFANSIKPSLESSSSQTSEPVKSHTSLDSMFNSLFSDNMDDIANRAGLFSGTVQI